ncbi:MAG: Hsp70 family protein [Parachlamydiales bacterium]
MTYVIGIDLGTTNSTLAYIIPEEENHEIHQFLIPQLTSAGTITEEPSLPSFIYFPLEEELEKGAAILPWDKKREYCIGIYARDRGGEAPNRLIHSAKSWLCHQSIDRKVKNLPYSTQASEAPRMSPLEACTAFLSYLKESWDFKMGKKAPFEQQEIFVTVPASFDPGARQLVQEAATLAGYPSSVILLEEPLAAFYSWLQRHAQDWRNHLKIGDTVLVVDIGGGTTDFSTIAVREDEGNLTLERKAVGSHLLLGGDNIDLSLAYMAKDKLEEKGQHIDDWQLSSLVHSCRREKEKVFSDPSLKHIEVAIVGRGSKLIGGTLKAKIAREEVLTILQQGFFPLVKASEQAIADQRIGLRQTGLPFAQDARITCQLAKFLSMTGEGTNGETTDFIVPTAVLFNGGTMKSDTFRQTLLDQINAWAQELGQPSAKELPAADLDHAVSSGAASYGLARKGKAVRVRAGTSRSYFIGIEDTAPAVPGRAPRIRALCVVPYGMEEGTEKSVEGQEFSLLLGEKATFRFFSHGTIKLSNGDTPDVGTIIPDWQKELSELSPIEMTLDKGILDGKMINVRLHTRVTELGVLELWCEAADGRRWKLEFNVRS